MAIALLLVLGEGCRLHGQTSPQPLQPAETTTLPAKPLAFDAVSVKPAPPGSFPLVPPFMRYKVPIIGLQKMAAPVWMTIAYAYSMQMNEALAAVRNQPAWVRDKVFTETFRVEGEPTRAQVREMVRTMLADRFGLRIHQFTTEGAVNKLVLNKPGVLGPKLRPHPEGAPCSPQPDASVGAAPNASRPPVTACGFSFHNLPGGVLHIDKTDTTVIDAAQALAGIEASELDSKPIVDATGLTGKYDVAIEFLPDSMRPFADSEADESGKPSLVRAMREQLGLRVESGQGPVRVWVIDHLSQPTPD